MTLHDVTTETHDTVAPAYEASASVVTVADPTGIAAESIRALRTQLMAVHERDELGALAVCGASPGAGATFVAVNLAVAMSQAGIKTLLVDGDMRQPGIDRMILGASRSKGLRQCLLSEQDSEEAIEHDVLANLSILYSGGAAPNPQELLSANKFRELIALWSREYDITIVDTPPASQSADGRYIAGVLGAALVIARKDDTPVHHLKTAIQELEQSNARVVGTVLNEY